MLVPTEEVSVLARAPAALLESSGKSSEAASVVFRGLRLKCGISVGQASANVHAALGRIAYRGREGCILTV
jgi:hypothetical protein